MRSKLGRVGVGAVALVGLLIGVGLGATPAGAAPLSCASVVTTSVVLQNDIGPCNDDGIIVAADNITVDLNGHQIFGLGGVNVPHQAAGVFSDNHRGVTIKNGTVHDFYHGIRIRRGSFNRVTQLTTRDNVGGNGIVFETSTDNLADRNVVIHNGRFSGMATFDTNSLPPAAARNRFESNTLRLNNGSTFGSPPSHGISIENGGGHVVRNNQVETSGRDGITLFSGVNNVLVERNYVLRNGGSGINVRAGARNNIVRNNTTTGNGQRGIVVAGSSNQILRNSSKGNVGRDLEDTTAGGACDANVWSANSYGTAFPACTQG